MGLPAITISGNAFLKSGSRWQTKGVVYAGSQHQTAANSAIDPLADPKQCAIDASAIKDLGANTISVLYVDPTKSHSECMKSFDDNGIYVLVTLNGLQGMSNQTWNMNNYKRFAAVVDSFAGYENLLGFSFGDQIIKQSGDIGVAPSVKAAVRDLKAYIAAREYRAIPVGYSGTDILEVCLQLAEYMVCGGNSSEAIDFWGMDLFEWCGDATYSSSGYQELEGMFKGLGIPLFLSQDGCNLPSPRKFTDQPVIFGPEMEDEWSGAIIYEWGQDSNSYGLVSYPSQTGSLPLTPSPLSDYSYLKSQWASVTTNTNAPSTFSTPACPTSQQYWTIGANAALPTIAGLNIATVTPASTAFASASPKAIPGNGGASSGLSNGAKIGVGVGVGLGAGLLLLALAAWLIWRRRKRANGNDTRDTAMEQIQTNPSSNGPPRLDIPAVSVPDASSEATWPSDLVNRDRGATELGSSEIFEASNQSNRHRGGTELHSSEIYEASAGLASLSQELSARAERSPNPLDNSGNGDQSSSAVSTLPDAIPVADPSSKYNELAEEADIAVQELGLIAVRKRALASQAATAGEAP
ncbi:hypothetical protein N7474_007766 [Penicillium riverlandense]|uniref:uncharacterized protein n=1 Tax=Penicillium riverlandense TaxID=1903569 RepID=UPI0025474062|nr:uncharacterized protein N7474_007766 [Penicillium riverlandense]KAJ5811465.1 hypothetical protein N7474_007766 [Penicillium riverlandense]